MKHPYWGGLLVRCAPVLKTVVRATILLAVCTAIAGCQEAASTISLNDGLPPTKLPSGLLARYTTSTIPVLVISPRPKKTLTPTLEQTAAPSSTAGSPSRTPFTATPALVITETCSPLETVDLKDLPRVVSDDYHPPLKGSDARHSGVDFAYYHWKGRGPVDGVGIQAVLNGKVVVSLKDTFPFGNVLVVETTRDNLPVAIQDQFGIGESESLYLLYAHMRDGSPLVALDQFVTACQPIGQVGMTGNAGAPHLHLEARVGPAGLRFETFSYYQDDITNQDRQNYRLWSVSGQYVTFDPMRLLLFEFNGGATSTPKGMRAP